MQLRFSNSHILDTQICFSIVGALQEGMTLQGKQGVNTNLNNGHRLCYKKSEIIFWRYRFVLLFNASSSVGLKNYWHLPISL